MSSFPTVRVNRYAPVDARARQFLRRGMAARYQHVVDSPEHGRQRRRLFGEGVKPKDLEQRLDGCWAVSPLQAYARVRPDLIESAFYERDGALFVRLVDRQGNDSFVPVNLDTCFTASALVNYLSKPWAFALTEAFVQSYRRPHLAEPTIAGRAAFMTQVMASLTQGHGAQALFLDKQFANEFGVPLADKEHAVAAMREALRCKRPVVLTTLNDAEVERRYLTRHHAYPVLSADKSFVWIQSSRGHSTSVPLEDLLTDSLRLAGGRRAPVFQELTIANVPPLRGPIAPSSPPWPGGS